MGSTRLSTSSSAARLAELRQARADTGREDAQGPQEPVEAGAPPRDRKRKRSDIENDPEVEQEPEHDHDCPHVKSPTLHDSTHALESASRPIRTPRSSKRRRQASPVTETTSAAPVSGPDHIMDDSPEFQLQLQEEEEGEKSSDGSAIRLRSSVRSRRISTKLNEARQDATEVSKTGRKTPARTRAARASRPNTPGQQKPADIPVARVRGSRRSTTTSAKEIALVAPQHDADSKHDEGPNTIPETAAAQSLDAPQQHPVIELRSDRTNMNHDALASIPPARHVPRSSHKSKKRIETSLASIDPAESFPPHHLAAIQRSLLSKMHRKAPSQLIDLDAEYTKLSNLLTQTILHGESNSLLLIGARGSGKSALLEHAIHANRKAHGNDFYTVRLNGFLHTDARIAFREIWAQLDAQMSADATSRHRNIADTVTTLLALLSHQDPDHASEEDELSTVTGSTRTSSKGVIFILEEFDLFTTHPRQTLLYNLFDIAQSQKAPVAVIGLTTHLGISETLEKRVKSRFSHRHLYLPLARDLDRYSHMCRSTLELQTNAADGSEDMQTSIQLWNRTVEHLFAECKPLIAHVRELYVTTKTVPDFQSSMIMPTGSLPIDVTTLGSPTASTSDLDPSSASAVSHTTRIPAQSITTHITRSLSPSQTQTRQTLKPPLSRLTILSSLSTLQLSLLIAAARLHHLLDTDLVSFALAYDEYKTLAANARIRSGGTAQGLRLWGYAVGLKAWEGLRESKLVLSAAAAATATTGLRSGSVLGGSGSGSVGGVGAGARAGPGGGLCRIDVSLEEIALVLEQGRIEVDGIMMSWCRQGL